MPTATSQLTFDAVPRCEVDRVVEHAKAAIDVWLRSQHTDADREALHVATAKASWDLMDAIQHDAGLRNYPTIKLPELRKVEYVDDGTDPFGE